MSFYCKRFQIRIWIWVAFVLLTAHFFYSIFNPNGDWFIRICVTIMGGCASLWWLWMMRTFDALLAAPKHDDPPKFKDDHNGN